MIRFDKVTMDAEIVQGDTGTFSFNIVSKTNKFDLDEKDKVSFIVKSNISNNTLIEKEVFVKENKVTIPLTPNETKMLDEDTYMFSLKLIRHDGNVDTLLPHSKEWAWFCVKEGVK